VIWAALFLGALGAECFDDREYGKAIFLGAAAIVSLTIAILRGGGLFL
jgi:hypothetical protein